MAGTAGWPHESVMGLVGETSTVPLMIAVSRLRRNTSADAGDLQVTLWCITAQSEEFLVLIAGLFRLYWSHDISLYQVI